MCLWQGSSGEGQAATARSWQGVFLQPGIPKLWLTAGRPAFARASGHGTILARRQVPQAAGRQKQYDALLDRLDGLLSSGEPGTAELEALTAEIQALIHQATLPSSVSRQGLTLGPWHCRVTDAFVGGAIAGAAAAPSHRPLRCRAGDPGDSGGLSRSGGHHRAIIRQRRRPGWIEWCVRECFEPGRDDRTRPSCWAGEAAAALRLDLLLVACSRRRLVACSRCLPLANPFPLPTPSTCPLPLHKTTPQARDCTTPSPASRSAAPRRCSAACGRCGRRCSVAARC